MQQVQDYIPDTPQGFRNWCEYKLNATPSWKHFRPRSLRRVDKLLSSVPCFADLMFYIQWHNLAIKTLHMYQIPTFVLYYEDYASNYNQTIRDLYQFVFDTDQINSSAVLQWNNHVLFQDTKIYHDYFTREQALAVEQAVQKLSNQSAWSLLQHYYHEYETDDGRH
jgi:hypothetical protein